MSIKPSIIKTFDDMYEKLRTTGLDVTDIIILIQKRTTPRQSITNIRATLEAIKLLERQIK